MHSLRIRLTVMSAVLAALAGCGSPRTGTETASGQQPHSHEGPHGGILLGRLDDGPLAEFVADRAGQNATVHFLDEEGRPAPVRANGLALALTSADDPVPLEPSPAEGESGGKSSRYVGRLPDTTRGRNLSGRLTGEVDGKPIHLDLAGHHHRHE